MQARTDLLDLIKNGTHYTEKRGDYLFLIDAVTGKVHSAFDKELKPLTPQVLPSGETIWSYAPNMHIRGTSAQAYSPLVIDQLCSKIMEGYSLSRICGTEGFPSYTTLCAWRRQHPWIDDAFMKARADRAEFMRDRAMQEAIDADETNVGSQKLKHEAYKWAAGVDDPAKYSPKAKIEATVHSPTMVLIDTGIVREAKKVIPELETTDVST